MDLYGCFDFEIMPLTWQQLNRIMKIFFTFIFFIFSLSAYAQDKEILIPYKKGNLWGFADTTGNIRVKPQFDSVDFFDRNNLAKVIKNNLTGFIDKTGNVLVPVQFTSCKSIPDFLFIVEKEGKFGIIDTSENYIADVKFDLIRRVGSKTFVAQNNNQFGAFEIVENKFNTIIDIHYESIKYYDYGVYKRFVCDAQGVQYLFNSKGEKIGEQKIIDDNTTSEPESKFFILHDDSPSEYPQFETIYHNKKKGLIIKTKSTKIGIGEYGQIIVDTIDARYDSVNAMHWYRNCYVVQNKNKWGAVNSEGEIVIDLKFSDIDIESMSFGNFRTQPYRQTFIVKNKRKWGLIGNTNEIRKWNKKNEILIPFNYDEIHRNTNHSFFIVKSNDKYGVILSSNLKLVTEVKYSNIKPTYNTIDGFILINVIDEYGNTVFVGQNGVEFFEK